MWSCILFWAIFLLSHYKEFREAGHDWGSYATMLLGTQALYGFLFILLGGLIITPCVAPGVGSPLRWLPVTLASCYSFPCIIPSDWVWARLSDLFLIEYSRSDSMPLRSWSYEKHVVSVVCSLVLSQLIHSRWSQLPCLEAALWRLHWWGTGVCQQSRERA